MADTTTSPASGAKADAPHRIPGRGWWQILKRCWRRWGQQQLPTMVAGLTFRCLLTLFPLLLAGASLTGLLTQPVELVEMLQPLTETLPPAAADFVTTNATRLATTSTSGLSIALASSVLLALWSLSNGMIALVGTYNQIYLEREHRHFLKVRGLALVLGLATIIAATLGIALLVAIPVAIGWVAVPAFAKILTPMVGFAVLGLIFITCQGLFCRFAVDRRPPSWHWLSAGTLASTLLWLGASALLSWYVTSVARIDRVYGALSGFIVLSLWLQITVTALFMGALVNSEVEHQTDVDSTVGGDAPQGERQAHMADHSVHRQDRESA